jgi:LacI family transcriptional regulator
VRLVVEHLIGLGHRALAHLAGPQAMSTGSTRAQAFREATYAAGLPPRQAPVFAADAYTAEAGERVAQELFEGRPDVTSICAGNDLIALGALRAMRGRGLDCPRDVSLVGFNDMRFADEFQPPLTTVRVPHHELGAEAARMLLAGMEAGDGGDPPVPAKAVLLPVRLVVRASTAAPVERAIGRAARTRGI